MGLFVVMTLVVLGLGLVVAQSLVMFTVLKYVGAAYLVWLGIHAFRHRRQLQVGDGSATESLRWQRALWQGVVVGVGNPKAFMIFAAVLPPFVAADRGAVALQMFLLGLLAVVIGLVCDSAWALVAGQARTWFAGSPRRAHALGAVGGSSMVALGVGMALTDSRD